MKHKTKTHDMEHRILHVPMASLSRCLTYYGIRSQMAWRDNLMTRTVLQRDFERAYKIAFVWTQQIEDSLRTAHQVRKQLWHYPPWQMSDVPIATPSPEDDRQMAAFDLMGRVTFGTDWPDRYVPDATRP